MRQNRPFPSSPQSFFRSESMCEIFVMVIKMISAQHSSNNGKNWQKLSYQIIIIIIIIINLKVVLEYCAEILLAW